MPLPLFFSGPRRSMFWAILMVVISVGQNYAAAPPQAPTLTLQHSTSQRGDFALIGNTLGFDCRSTVPSPVVGTVDRNHCQTAPIIPSVPNSDTTKDTSIDVLWQVDHPAVGQTQADILVTPATASSEAVLQLPVGAVVTYARLYWSATLTNSVTSFGTVTLSRKDATRTTNVFSQNLIADHSDTIINADNTFGFAYQSGVDVTSLVRTYGSGSYLVSNVPMTSPVDATKESNYAAWSLVVFYQLPTGPTRLVTLFDGLLEVSQQRYNDVTVGMAGFLVPNDAGWDAKFGTIVYEGDSDINNDQLLFNGQPLTDATNPANNFFNGTRSWLGTAVSVLGDLPQLTGASNSMMGLDLDVINIKPNLHSGDTHATLEAKTTGDTFFLGAFITSISTLVPDFNDMPKTFHNTSGPDDKIKPGDTVEYSIVVQNKGSDQAVNTVWTDPIPSKTTYVAGSLCIVNGLQCDPVTSTQGGYDSATNLLTVRLGTGSTSTQGGSMDVDGSPITLKFKVKVNQDATGIVSNQAKVTCSGAQSMSLPPWVFNSGNGTDQNTPTTFPVFICDLSSDCHNEMAPFCDTSSPVHFCTDVCHTDEDCMTARGPGWICKLENPSLPKHCIPTADLALFVNASDVDGDNQVTYDLKAGNLGPGTAPQAVITYQLPVNVIVVELTTHQGWTCAPSLSAITCTTQAPFEVGVQSVGQFVVRAPVTETSLLFQASIQAISITDPHLENNTVRTSSALNRYSLNGGGFSWGCAAVPSHTSVWPEIIFGLTVCASAFLWQRRRVSLFV